MSCTHFDVQIWYLFAITYNHKTNHQGGSNLVGTPVSCHKVHMSVVVQKCEWNDFHGIPLVDASKCPTNKIGIWCVDFPMHNLSTFHPSFEYLL